MSQAQNEVLTIGNIPAAPKSPVINEEANEPEITTNDLKDKRYSLLLRDCLRMS